MARVDYKFYLGQRVEYCPPQGTFSSTAYVVTTKLPKRDGEFEYRISMPDDWEARPAWEK